MMAGKNQPDRRFGPCQFLTDFYGFSTFSGVWANGRMGKWCRCELMEQWPGRCVLRFPIHCSRIENDRF